MHRKSPDNTTEEIGIGIHLENHITYVEDISREDNWLTSWVIEQQVQTNRNWMRDLECDRQRLTE